MGSDRETPENRRERMRQKELKRNPTGNLSDGFNQANSGHPGGLFDNMGWKGAIVLVLVLIVAFIIAALFFQ
ncbi:DUF6366 family protein [Planococcus lenghuensis]|uniref:DUF6366 family protein n=1 Tax=Planococcus lenghuensis TaxID=2213202 RepID=UPI001E3E111A|nr:DUF6366 family protein [Planococcus lenghuensis]